MTIAEPPPLAFGVQTGRLSAFVAETVLQFFLLPAVLTTFLFLGHGAGM